MRPSFSILFIFLTASGALAQQGNMDGVPIMQAEPIVPPRAVAVEAVPAATPQPDFYSSVRHQQNDVGLVAPAPTPQPVFYTSIDSLDDKRKLAVGDHVSYRVIEDKNPAVDLIVTDSGDMDVPLLGRVAAAGKTCRQLALDMKPVLEKTYFYKATVIVALDLATVKSPGRIYVSGNVTAPGPQDMPPDEVYTLSKAITRAGGVGQFGNDHRVKIVRKQDDGTTQDTEYDVGEIINKGRIDKDPVLQPNDLIVVPRKLINF